jgi:inner membrane protein involved in colicin E2 resistance
MGRLRGEPSWVILHFINHTLYCFSLMLWESLLLSPSHHLADTPAYLQDVKIGYMTSSLYPFVMAV